MKTTYQPSLLWFLVAILMVPTAYGQVETVLVANFLNGNNAVLNSRVYLFNSSDTAGDITVRVFRLPLLSGLPEELTGAPLSLGVLGAKSAVNIKLAEDILFLLGKPLPYTDDGGNLTLEFTIGAEKVRGVAQVFTDNFAFGTYPLQGPESIIGTVPSGEIPDGSVTSSKIANGAVGSVQLADTVIFGASNSPGQISVVNSTNNATLTLGNLNNEGLLNVNDAAGNLKVALQVTDNGGLVGVQNSTDNATIILGNFNNTGALDMNDAGGNLKVALRVTSNGGQISVRNSTGNTTSILGNFDNEGVLNFLGSGENLKVFLGVSDNGG